MVLCLHKHIVLKVGNAGLARDSLLVLTVPRSRDDNSQGRLKTA